MTLWSPICLDAEIPNGWPTGRIRLPQTGLFGTLMCFCKTIIRWGRVASSPSGGPVSPIWSPWVDFSLTLPAWPLKVFCVATLLIGIDYWIWKETERSQNATLSLYSWENSDPELGSALPETSPKVNDRVKTRRKWFPLTGKNQILREILGGEKKRGREGGGREGEKRERGEEKQEGKVGGEKGEKERERWRKTRKDGRREGGR